VLKHGYCVVSYDVDPNTHPEQGPAWEHYFRYMDESLARVGGELNGKEGPTRKISDDVLDELKSIFKVTGGQELYNTIEEASEQKAAEMGLEFRKREGTLNISGTWSRLTTELTSPKQRM